MPVQVTIEDADLAGFSDAAKARLSDAAHEYVGSIIEEANRIEVSRNSHGPSEITHGMVTDAVIVNRRGLGIRQTNGLSKVLRIVSAVSCLIVGVMYDVSDLQDKVYLASFIVLIAVAILTMTVSILKE